MCVPVPDRRLPPPHLDTVAYDSDDDNGGNVATVGTDGRAFLADGRNNVGVGLLEESQPNRGRNRNREGLGRGHRRNRRANRWMSLHLARELSGPAAIDFYTDTFRNSGTTPSVPRPVLNRTGNRPISAMPWTVLWRIETQNRHLAVLHVHCLLVYTHTPFCFRWTGSRHDTEGDSSSRWPVVREIR